MLEFGPLAIVLIIVLGLAVSGIKILKEYERGVVFRLGRMVNSRGPGLIYLIPFIEKMERGRAPDRHHGCPFAGRHHPGQRIGEGQCGALFPGPRSQPGHPGGGQLSVRHVALAQVTLRSICGQAELDQLLSERDRINADLQKILDEQTDPWGIKVVLTELKHIDLPEEMQRAMARQASAERERRAKIILADGEFQASPEAAGSGHGHCQGAHGHAAPIPAKPAGSGRRQELHADLPVPIDLLTPFLNKMAENDSDLQPLTGNGRRDAVPNPVMCHAAGRTGLRPSEALISAYPVEDRVSARLMVVDRRSGAITHSRFASLGEFLSPGDLLVLTTPG